MTLRFRPHLLRAVLLALLLMGAQLLLLQHQADLGLHASGENCEWCLAHAPLGGALPAAGLSLPMVGHAPPTQTRHAPLVVASASRTHSARAPPLDRFL